MEIIIIITMKIKAQNNKSGNLKNNMNNNNNKTVKTITIEN